MTSQLEQHATMTDNVFDDSSDRWLNLGSCPVCQNGLRRIRIAFLADGRNELFALCDECEAMWTTPQSTYHFGNSEYPACPGSGLPLYGPMTAWATRRELAGTIWEPYVIPESTPPEELGY